MQLDFLKVCNFLLQFRINKKYNLEAIPASYLIDADGHIKAQVVGAMNETALADFLKQAQ